MEDIGEKGFPLFIIILSPGAVEPTHKGWIRLEKAIDHC